MVKKILKNALLIGSVLLAVILVSQIWFSSYFLPDGYGFFVSSFHRRIITPVMDFFKQDGGSTFSQNLQNLYKPERIVVNVSGERCAYVEGQESYAEAYALSNDILNRMLTGAYKVKSKTTIDRDAYTSALKGKSIYVDYGKNCDYRLFSFSISGKSQSRFSDDLSAVSGHVISLQDSIMNDISLYIIDQKSSNIFRYVIEANNKDEVNQKMEELRAQTPSAGSLSYSFELNFHKEQENAASKILFEPMILMDLAPAQVSRFESHRLDEFVQGISEDMINTILRTFSINTRSMWHYTDLTNARVFVENNATLTLSPDGLIEYQTVGNGRGLDISDNKNAYDIYAATDNAMDFVTRLCSHMPPEIFENLRIRTDMVDDADKQGVYHIYFDYCVDGIPIRHKTETGYAHTIEMEINNGYLKSYRQYIRTYEKTNQEKITALPVLSAADLLVDALYKEPEPLRVQRINLCYVEDEAGVLTPTWNALIGGQEHIVQ